MKWPFYRNLARISPWLLFFLLFLLPENRKARAWAILIPMAFVCGPVIVLDLAIAAFGGTGLGPLNDAAQTFTLAIGALWLLGDRLAGTSGWRTLGKALLAAFVVSLVALTGFSALDFGSWWTVPGGMAGVAVGAVVLGFPMAAVFCRKRVTPPAFAAGLFLGILAVSLVLLMTGVAVWAAFMVRSADDFFQAAFSMAASIIASGFLGVATFAATLAFIMLAFLNDLFLDRLHRVLRKPLPSEAKKAETPLEQEDTPEVSPITE